MFRNARGPLLQLSLGPIAIALVLLLFMEAVKRARVPFHPGRSLALRSRDSRWHCKKLHEFPLPGGKMPMRKGKMGVHKSDKMITDTISVLDQQFQW